MYSIEIWVTNTLNNQREKPDKYNTYWKDGQLKGKQDWLKVEYEIKLYPKEDDD